MNISEDELRKAAGVAGVSPQQTDVLWQDLQSRWKESGKPKFDVANVAYYLGALIVIGAMGWFMNKAWERLGGLGLFAAASAYGVCFIWAGRTLWNRHALRIPGGLLVTMAVCMVPLATYGIERWLGLWPAGDPGSYTNFHPLINGSWLIMEAATIIAGLIALCFWRFPFLTAPIAYALWFMSMDLADRIVGHRLEWNEREIISTIFGAVMIFAAYVTDLRGKANDFAFWIYLFGLMSFWGGLSAMDSNSELGKFVYCLINIALIFCSLALRRRTFIVFGALGLFGYLSHLAYRVFENSLLFPVVLSFIGLAIIYLGLQYQRRRDQIERSFRARIAPYIRGFIPARALTD
jgi:hypothetical protein